MKLIYLTSVLTFIYLGQSIASQDLVVYKKIEDKVNQFNETVFPNNQFVCTAEALEHRVGKSYFVWVNE